MPVIRLTAPVISLLWCLYPLLCVDLGAATVCHSSGCTTYTCSGVTSINVSGGCATFSCGGSSNGACYTFSNGTSVFNSSWTIQNNTTVCQTGGCVTFNASFPNGSTLNLSGGNMTINSLNNNADINVTGGTLLLGTNFSLGSGDLNLGPGTLQTNGEDITNFDSITLTGNSTIDLTGGTNETLDFSSILSTDGGSYTLDFVGWDSGDTIDFDDPIPSGVTVLVDGNPATFDANNTITGSSVPEASTLFYGFGIAGIGLWFELRRRSREA